MIVLGLDMASNSCGVALLSKDKIEYGSFVIPTKERKELSNPARRERMINWILENIQGHLKKEHILIVEDVFLGRNAEAFKNVCRLQGALEHTYFKLTGKEIKYVMAVSARKDLELNTRASKAECQLFVIEKFKLKEFEGRLAELKAEVEREREDYSKKKMSSSTFKKHMDKLSKEIEKVTGIDEHKADSIILCLGGR